MKVDSSVRKDSEEGIRGIVFIICNQVGYRTEFSVEFYIRGPRITSYLCVVYFRRTPKGVHSRVMEEFDSVPGTGVRGEPTEFHRSDQYPGKPSPLLGKGRPSKGTRT